MLEALAFMIFSLLIAYAVYRSVKGDDVDQWRVFKAKPNRPEAFGAKPKMGPESKPK